MWFRKKPQLPLVHQEEIDAVRAQTNQALTQLSANVDELNKALEERNDIAYNVFVATGGLRRQNKDNKNK